MTPCESTANLRAVCLCAALATGLLTIGSSRALADIIHVYPSGESIQTAINTANNGDEIIVHPGTYYEAIDFLGKAVWLHSSDGPAVTTIDGNGAYHVVQCVNDEGPDTILGGFTITGGNADGPYPDDRGGGMFIKWYSTPTVTNCTFTNNSALGNGGGMCTGVDGTPTVANCTFTGNSAGEDGGGMYNGYYSSPTVTNCTFTGNSAGYDGGGMCNYGESSPTVTSCTFSGNFAGEGGGVCT
jgi:parallel beta-helix repeat protein